MPLLKILPQSSTDYPHVRCAALYAAGFSFSERVEGPQSEASANQFSEAIGFHLALAHLSRGLPVETLETELDAQLEADVARIQSRYDSLTEEAYISSGNAISGMLGEDLSVCQALRDSLVEQAR